MNCFFVSDLHGSEHRLNALFAAIRSERPAAVFVGGDILLSGIAAAMNTNSERAAASMRAIIGRFGRLRDELGADYPQVFVILGNDDGRLEESDVIGADSDGVWRYVHNQVVAWNELTILGYSFVPPTPFQLKDWERYDVSRFVDPGCISPEEGIRTVPVAPHEARYATIQKDLKRLTENCDLEHGILLFHTPPYETNLDIIDNRGKLIAGVQPDHHVGSIAVRRLIERRQPRISLHGHIHESARLSGSWRDRIGSTLLFSAAHDGPELALVTFSPENPELVTRRLI